MAARVLAAPGRPMCGIGVSRQAAHPVDHERRLIVAGAAAAPHGPDIAAETAAIPNSAPCVLGPFGPGTTDQRVPSQYTITGRLACVLAHGPHVVRCNGHYHSSCRQRGSALLPSAGHRNARSRPLVPTAHTSV